MKVERAPSYPVSIFIAGSYDHALAACCEHCDKIGLCVTVTATTYAFTGGAETGVIVGLINYPRFPAAPSAILDRAHELGNHLRLALRQESYSIQTPEETIWKSWRESAELPDEHSACPDCGWLLDYSCRPPCGCAALAAGTRSAETGETPAPSEGCQSGPKGSAQQSEPREQEG